MGWHDIRDTPDVGELMEAVEHFHDWYLAGFKYDPLATAEDGSKSLARCTSETDALVLLMRYGSTDESGDWPEIEMEFTGIRAMHFSNYKEPDPFHECWLERVDHGWVFVPDCPLTDAERKSPADIRADLLVVSGCVRWRQVGGARWASG